MAFKDYLNKQDSSVKTTPKFGAGVSGGSAVATSGKPTAADYDKAKKAEGNSFLKKYLGVGEKGLGKLGDAGTFIGKSILGSDSAKYKDIKDMTPEQQKNYYAKSGVLRTGPEQAGALGATNTGYNKYKAKMEEQYTGPSYKSLYADTSVEDVDYNKRQREIARSAGDYYDTSVDEVNAFGEMIKGFKQGSNNAMSALGTSYSMLGQELEIKGIQEHGQKMEDYFKKIVVANPEWNQSEDMGKWDDPRFYTRMVGEGIPSIGGAFATSAAATVATGGNVPAGLAAGFTYAKALEGGFAYQEAKKYGATDETAKDIGDKVGTINGVLEMLPIGKFLNKSPQGKAIKKNIFNRITKGLVYQGVEEAPAEGLQEMVSNAFLAELDENRGLFDGVLESMAAGFILGGGTGVAGVMTQHPGTAKEIYKKAQKMPIGLSVEDITKNPEKYAKELGIKVEEIPLAIEAMKYDSAEDFVDASFVDIEQMQSGSYLELAEKLGFSTEEVKLLERVDAAMTKLSKEENRNISYKDAKEFVSVEDVSLNKLDTLEVIEKLEKSIIPRSIKAVQEKYATVGLLKQKSEIESQLTDFYNKVKEAAKTGTKEAIQETDQQKVDDAEVLTPEQRTAMEESFDIKGAKKEGVKGTEEVENQYTQFKQLKIKGLDQVEDVEQLKGKVKVAPEVIDNILYSQDKTQDEMFIEFKERKAKEPKRKRKVVETKRMYRSKILRKIRDKQADVEQIKKDVIAYAKKHLELHERGKLLATVKNAKTHKDLEKARDYIERLEEKATIKTTKAKIKKLLSKTKVKKQSGKIVGKYTPEIQKTLDMFRTASKMKKEELYAQIETNLEVMGDDPAAHADLAQQNMAYDIMANLDEMGSADVKKLYDSLVALINDGKFTRELRKFNFAEKMAARRGKALETILGGKDLKDTTTFGKDEYKKFNYKNIAKSLGKSNTAGWDTILDMLSFNDKTSKAGDSWLNRTFETLDQENAQSAGIRSATDKLHDMFWDAYGIKNDREMRKQMRADTEEIVLGVFNNTDGKAGELKFSKAEARKRWMELQDKTLDETFKESMGYTDEIIGAIDNFLTNGDKAFAQAQLDFYQEYYNGINKVYRELYGVDLTNNKNYSPIAREDLTRDQETGFGEFLQEQVTRGSITKGSHKARVASMKPLKQKSDIQVLQQHVAEMEHFKAWAETVREMQAVFGDSKISKAIEQEFGPKMKGEIDSFIKDFTRGGVETANNISGMDRIRINFTRAVLAAKPAILVKQWSSMPAFAETIPIKDFVSGSFDFWKHPIENMKLLRESSELMKARGKNMERDMKALVASDAYRGLRKGKSFLDLLMLNVQIGDQGAIVAGGWSVYKYHYDKAIKEGKTKQEAKTKAINEFEKATKKAQQSGAISDLSRWQRGNSAMKMFTMFKTSQNQYLRKEISTVRNLLAGRISKKQAAKTIAIYHLILPMVFQFISDGFKWDKDEQKRAMLLGSLNGIFIAGDGLNYVLRQVLGLRTFDLELPVMSVVTDIASGIAKLTKDDISTEDVYKAIDYFMGSAGKVSGVPLQQALRAGRGVKETASGEYEKGIMRAMGWSVYGIEQEEKKKPTKKRTTRPIKRVSRKKPTRKLVNTRR